MQQPASGLFSQTKKLNYGRGTEVVVTGSTRNRLVLLIAGHVGSNPTLSARLRSKRSEERSLPRRSLQAKPGFLVVSLRDI
jgi:hypothetical protein